MKYNSYNISIPQGKRQEINDKVISVIELNLQEVTQEDIYNSYTGIGGLHGLNRSEFKNYKEFSDEKKLIELGQFFTPHHICCEMVQLVKPSKMDLIADLSCGMGNFFNFLPTEVNVYGCDIDRNAVKVARFLYPEAHLQVKDIQHYSPEVRFDIVFGNPPFNLMIAGELSQRFYCIKAAELLKPGGILAIIAPLSWLSDDFMDGGEIDLIDDLFNFIVQFKLPASSFKSLGVDHFETKVLLFQKKSDHIPDKTYKHNLFADYDIEKIHETYIVPVLGQKDQLRAKLLLEFQSKKESNSFEYRVCKYMYQIKTNPKASIHYQKCADYIENFKRQEKPKDVTLREWEKTKITERKVIAYLKRNLRKQHIKEIEKIALVKSKYDFRIKPYSKKTRLLLNSLTEEATWSINDLILKELPNIDIPGFSIDSKAMGKTIKRKRRQYELQGQSFKSMSRSTSIDRFLEDFTFINHNGETCRFNAVQKNDLGLILQKRYSQLNWQQGSGKTPAAYAWAQYQSLIRHSRNTIIAGPALAINLTWEPFLINNKESYTKITSLKDLQLIRPGQFVLISLNMLIKFQRYLKKLIRIRSQKIAFIFDESDESTNHTAKRSKAVLNCFRRVKYKLLSTGTTTRNNLTELFTQLEILYNNSVNMLCECEKLYEEVKDKETGGTRIETDKNSKYFMKPYPARSRYGNRIFRMSFNPAKTTVFGIKKHNQDIYNPNQLIKLVEKTMITRKFKEIVGEGRYSIHSHRIKQNPQEEYVYSKIIYDLLVMIQKYCNRLDNENKERMMEIIRQIQLLIKATSMPQSFGEYQEYQGPQKSLFSNYAFTLPNKFEKIVSLVRSFVNEKVAIGCTTLEASSFYYDKLKSLFPGRKVFLIQGDVTFKARGSIISQFEETSDGILVSTQQSLKSSVSIPLCQKVIVESLQWNIPRIEQYYFRFIRYDSQNHVQVHIVSYKNSIEINLLALLICKERLNEFIKTLEIKDQADIFEEYDLDQNLIDLILRKGKDREGKSYIRWGSQSVY